MKSLALTLSTVNAYHDYKIQLLLEQQSELIGQIENIGIGDIFGGGVGKDKPHLPFEDSGCPTGYSETMTSDGHKGCKLPKNYPRGFGSLFPNPLLGETDKYGNRYFMPCKPGYAPLGCCVCASICPHGMSRAYDPLMQTELCLF